MFLQALCGYHISTPLSTKGIKVNFDIQSDIPKVVNRTEPNC